MDESKKNEIRTQYEKLQAMYDDRPEYEYKTERQAQRWLSWSENYLLENHLMDAALEQIDSECTRAGHPALDARRAIIKLRQINDELLKANTNAWMTLERLQHEPKKKQPEYDKLPAPPDISQYGIMSDKVNRNYLSDVTEMEIDGIDWLVTSVNQAKPGQAPVITTFMLSTGPDEKITTSQRIDAQDEAITTAAANFVFKLKERGDPAPYKVTPDDIWRTMRGITDKSRTPSANERKDIIKRLDRLRLINMKIDVADELERGFLSSDDHIKDGVIEDTYIAARKGHATTQKGRVVDAYEFYDVPYIYTYNHSKGHLALVDYSLLDVSDTIEKSGTYTDIFKLYLLREIQNMYSHKRDSTKIFYETVYKSTGIPTPEARADSVSHKTENARQTMIKKYSKNDRDEITAILKSWEKRKWINGVFPVKDGRRFIGIDIVLNPKNKASNKKLIAS